MNYNNEERLGIHAVGRIFNKEFGWIFREQPVNGFGIDALIEITRADFNANVTSPIGKLFGVQIKSGKSYLKEFVSDQIVFRGLKKHLDYWLNYSIPVILILYDKTTDNAYWQLVSYSTVMLTAKSFKIQIPKENRLSFDDREKLISVAFYKDVYQYKLEQLLTATEVINLLLSGKLFLYVEIDDIPNTNYYHITLAVTDFDTEKFYEALYYYEGENTSLHHMRLHKNTCLTTAINDTFPWANLWLNGNTVTDELLIDLIAEDTLSYNIEDTVPEVYALKQQHNLLKLACYLSGSHWLKFDLKTNPLTEVFLKVNDFLRKEPVAQKRILI